MIPGSSTSRVRAFLPGYMTMGQDGMGDMGDMGMKIPPNSVPMVGSPGPHGYITMGGMYTNVKVREDLGDLKPEEGKDFAYGGWYKKPALVPRRSPPRRTSCAATSAACPSPSGPGSRCTTWTTVEGKREESLQNMGSL